MPSLNSVRQSTGAAQQFAATRQIADDAGCGFLLAELDAGMAFADVALLTEDAKKRNRNKSNALAAYAAILRFMDRIVFNQAEELKFLNSFDLLKDKLSRLGIPT